jgi:hypothetical protein
MAQCLCLLDTAAQARVPPPARSGAADDFRRCGSGQPSPPLSCSTCCCRYASHVSLGRAGVLTRALVRSRARSSRCSSARRRAQSSSSSFSSGAFLLLVCEADAQCSVSRARARADGLTTVQRPPEIRSRLREVRCVRPPVPGPFLLSTPLLARFIAVGVCYNARQFAQAFSFLRPAVPPAIFCGAGVPYQRPCKRLQLNESPDDPTIIKLLNKLIKE